MFSEISFPGKHNDEQIVLFLRRHWFILFVHLVSVFMAVLGLVLIYIFLNLSTENLAQSEYFNLLLLGESFGTIFIWNLFFILWLDYYLDTWIVTNERIININQKGFFCRNISELKLTKIQDVTSEIAGVIPTLLDYGNIHVQTAGEKERFVFYQIPNPNKVKNVIAHLQEKEKREEDKEMGKAIRGEI